MPTYSYVEIPSKEGALLCDLTSYHHDFRSAGNFARLAREERKKQTPDDNFVIEAFWVTALIYYSRCFMGGIRTAISSELLALLTPAQRVTHDKILNIRSKYVAHSVNGFEESIPVAVFDEQTVEKIGIHSVHCNHARVMGLSEPDHASFIELIELFHLHLMGRLQEEEARLLKVVNAMPLEKLKSNRIRPMLQNAGNPNKRRN